MNSSAARLFHDVKQFTLLTVTTPVFVVMYYSHPFRLAKTSLAKQSTSHCVVFDTQADFVGAIEHIAPMAITNSLEISVKSGRCAQSPPTHGLLKCAKINRFYARSEAALEQLIEFLGVAALVERDFPQRAGSGPGERCKRFIAVARGKLALILPS